MTAFSWALSRRQDESGVTRRLMFDESTREGERLDGAIDQRWIPRLSGDSDWQSKGRCWIASQPDPCSRRKALFSNELVRLSKKPPVWGSEEEKPASGPGDLAERTGVGHDMQPCQEECGLNACCV